MSTTAATGHLPSNTTASTQSTASSGLDAAGGALHFVCSCQQTFSVLLDPAASSSAATDSDSGGNSYSVLSHRVLRDCHMTPGADTTVLGVLRRLATVADAARLDLPLCALCYAASQREQWARLAVEQERVAEAQAFLDDSKQLSGAAFVGPSSSQGRSNTVRDEDDDDEEIAALRRETSAMRSELSQLNVSHAEADQRLADIAAETRIVAGKEAFVAARLNDVLAQERLLRDNEEGLDERLSLLRQETARLSSTTLLRVAFRLSFDAATSSPSATEASHTLGSINGFRIARHSQVANVEVNAGCGLLCHLIDYIARSIKFRSARVVLHPRGDVPAVDSVTAPPAGSPPSAKLTVTTNDFYIIRRFFRWPTFGAAWASVGLLVDELYVEMRQRMAEQQAKVKAAAASGGADDDLVTQERQRLLTEGSFTRLEGGEATAALSGNTLRHDKAASDVAWNTAVRCFLRNVQWLSDAHPLLVARDDAA